MSADHDPPLTIASGGIPDLADVMVVMGDAFDPGFGEAWTEAQCAGVLGMPGAWLLIARRGDQPAGFALLRTVLDEAELLLIAVRPVFRRQGVGDALMNRIVADAMGIGLAALHLEVRGCNPARLLYLRSGFVQIGMRRDYYRGNNGRTFDALTFKRSLERNPR